MSAARSLLELAEDGNGSQFCEPYSGTASSTIMTIHDIEQLEVGYRNMQDENIQLRSECECLKTENKRLVKENTSLKEKCLM
jgi:hypothetical protein